MQIHLWTKVWPFEDDTFGQKHYFELVKVLTQFQNFVTKIFLKGKYSIPIQFSNTE